MAADLEVLDRAEWRARRAAHEERVERWTAPRLQRRARGEAHPVDDFLWEYYAFRPGQLRRWHPGAGVGVKDPDGAFSAPGYEVQDAVARVIAPTARRLRDAELILTLLRATANRAASFTCFGMHEWAMVYRASADEIRHSQFPLRLAAQEVDDLVQTSRLTCTHFDAFRFFTPAAAPLNAQELHSSDRSQWEQPGCIHANMDLYKHAYRLSPWVSSELVADAFELAGQARQVDMAASPYDLSSLGVVPIRVETPEGRSEYARVQRELATASAPLRDRLIDAVTRVVAAATP